MDIKKGWHDEGRKEGLREITKKLRESGGRYCRENWRVTNTMSARESIEDNLEG